VTKEEQIRFNRKKAIDAFDPCEPEDIFWENFKYSFMERVKRTLSIFGICLFVIGFSFGCVFGLTLLQDHLYDNNQGVTNSNIALKYLISLASTLVISLLNVLIEFILNIFTLHEKQLSRSEYILSLSIKNSLLTFLNSAIVPLSSKHFAIWLNEDEDKVKKDKYYIRRRERDNLLIDDMLIYFIVNAIFYPLMWSLNIPFIFKKIYQCCVEKGKWKIYITQKELNKRFENPDMDLAYKYSYLVKTIAMCYFFLPIFPLGFIISFVGFIFGYFIEKFNFTHLYKRPEMLDEIITKEYSEYFVIILFI
jgi:hypothetical protein